MEEKKTLITISDKYGDQCLIDKIDASDKNKRSPQGFVEIYDIQNDGSKKLVGKSNLVVYQGREYIAERIFNTENASTSTTLSQYICWFGLGSGGAPIGDPLNPDAPTSNDTGLDTEVPLNATNATYADFRSGNYWKHPLDTIQFEQDSGNNNKWLIVKVTTTIGLDDANGYNLNEAGLFLGSSNIGGFAGPFHLFSRVTFPTIVKDSSRQLMFIWYIYT